MDITPDNQVLKSARQRAYQRGRSVFVYCDRGVWQIADKLTDTASGARIVEVAPDAFLSETRNQGGC